MSTSDKSLPKKKGHPLRKLIFLAVVAGIVVAIKNALEDKGGSYEAPAAAKPSTTPVPTPPVPPVGVKTAEDILAHQPIENLDEFADPVEPTIPAEPVIPEAEEPEETHAAPGKIDPFGIR